MSIEVIGLDADDTLWHNESFYRATQERLAELLSHYGSATRVASCLADIERQNLKIYGFGAKGFTLSMLEVALNLGGPDLPASVVREILALGREILVHPVETLPGVEETLPALAERGRLVLITKGDLFHQEAKLAASGLGDFFSGVEIVSNKGVDTFRRIFARYSVSPGNAVMVGNSIRSDILPALEAGCFAVHVPYPIVWDLEDAEAPYACARFAELPSLLDLPALIDTINHNLHFGQPDPVS